MAKVDVRRPQSVGQSEDFGGAGGQNCAAVGDAPAAGCGLNLWVEHGRTLHQNGAPRPGRNCPVVANIIAGQGARLQEISTPGEFIDESPRLGFGPAQAEEGKPWHERATDQTQPLNDR